MLQFPCVLHNFTASSSWAVRELRLRTNQKRKSRWIRHLHLLNVEMYETLSCQFIRWWHVNVALQVCRKSAVADLSFAIITRSFMLKLEPSSWYPTKIMFAEEKQHNSQSLWNNGNGLNKSFTSTSPSLDSPLYSHIEALQKHGSIRTKCLPCRSAEGGTSTAIRANWLYLRSVQECWH